MKQPNYFFSPTLLDQFCNLCDSDSIYEKYYGKSETPELTAEEFHETKFRELIDRINNVRTSTTEAQAKGICLNEIVDSIIKRKPCANKDVFIKTIRTQEDFFDVVLGDKEGSEVDVESIKKKASETLAKIGKAFIYARLENFEFFFDVEFCKRIAEYFDKSICQFYTSALLETSKGVVELHGYLDYFRMKAIYDLKTCKSYNFGNYSHYNQRFAYPYCMIKSGMMTDVQEVEFTAYKLTGGNNRFPLITGEQYREVYTYNHDESTKILTQVCERFIDFVNDNIDKIDKNKTRIFG